MPSILPSFFIATSFCIVAFGSASYCTIDDDFSFMQKFALAEARAHQEPSIEERVGEQVKKIEHEMGGHSLSLATLLTVHDITYKQMRKLHTLGIYLNTATEEGVDELDKVPPNANMGVFDEAANHTFSKYKTALDPVIEMVHTIYNTTVPALKQLGCPVISLRMGNNLSQALNSIDTLNQTASEVGNIVKSLDTVRPQFVDRYMNGIKNRLRTMEGMMKTQFTTNVQNAFDAYMNGLLAHVEEMAAEDEKDDALDQINQIGPLVNLTVPLLVDAETKLSSGFAQAINARGGKMSQLVEKKQRHRHHRKHR